MSAKAKTKFKLRVKDRDGWRCCNCGNLGRASSELTVHHDLSRDEYPELRNKTANGETLCEKCHKEEEDRREKQKKIVMQEKQEKKKQGNGRNHKIHGNGRRRWRK